MYQVIPLVRDLINDNLVACSPEVFEYVSSKTYTLSEANISWVTLSVCLNGTKITNYTTYQDTNKVKILTAMEETDTVEFYYSAYKRYSYSAIEVYIKSALYYISVYRFLYDYIVTSGNVIVINDTSPEEYPSLRAKRMIALIASILIDGSITSYRTPDISISFVEKLSKEEKIERVVEKHRERYGNLDYHYYLTSPDAWYLADD